jgi:hypothetical protein
VGVQVPLRAPHIKLFEPPQKRWRKSSVQQKILNLFLLLDRMRESVVALSHDPHQGRPGQQHMKKSRSFLLRFFVSIRYISMLFLRRLCHSLFLLVSGFLLNGCFNSNVTISGAQSLKLTSAPVSSLQLSGSRVTLQNGLMSMSAQISHKRQVLLQSGSTLLRAEVVR